MNRCSVLLMVLLVLLFFNCKEEKKNLEAISNTAEVAAKTVTPLVKEMPEGAVVPEGMVWITGGEFYQGAVDNDNMAMGHERPRHKVGVNGFFMDIHEVTNAQFSKFVDATGYLTVAERKIDWEEMQKQLPPGTPKPHDSILQPGSLVFKKTKSTASNLYDYSQWWEWKIGASWQHPNGPTSSIKGKENHPVVHMAYEDAIAYCDWAKKRLPTEAEWEYAARANQEDAIFFWGVDKSSLSSNANTWEGEFPVNNTKEDGFERLAPVMNYSKNNFGLYDMAGNVWEWTSDWYNTEYYAAQSAKTAVLNPKGAGAPYNSSNPLAREKIIKGGSFLCSDSYCASYRISARMATSIDSGLEHTGFRTVMDLETE